MSMSIEEGRYCQRCHVSQVERVAGRIINNRAQERGIVDPKTGQPDKRTERGR